jgi:predicted HicB family RNase H-like nuclease
MNAKQRRTLEAIFAKPVPSDLRWAEIESLLVALGAERSEGRGSRVRFRLHSAESGVSSPASQSEYRQRRRRGRPPFSRYCAGEAMILKHDGYIAEVGYEEGDSLMHGTVVNARAVLHFAGRDIAELRAAFVETIADYRDWCRERGIEPEKPYSGTLSLRISPELHRRVAERAAKAGASINQFIAERLEEVA